MEAKSMIFSPWTCDEVNKIQKHLIRLCLL